MTTDPSVLERLDALERGMAEMRAAQRPKVPANECDMALLEALAIRLEGGNFTTNDFVTLITGALGFKEYADDADVTAATAAYWLRDMTGAYVGPLELVRVGTTRPAIWRFS